MSEQSKDIYRSSHSNAHSKIDRTTVATMNRRVESELNRFRETTERSRQMSFTSEERDLRQAARLTFLKNLGIDASVVTRLRTSRQERLRGLLAVRDLPHHSHLSPTQEDHHDGPDSLVMWWAQTNSWGNAPGIAGSWQDDGSHFSGVVHVDNDDLQKYSLTIVAQFALGADRIPDSARGPVLSAPFANVYGMVYAIAKDFSVWDAFDDQWAKCWLNTRQSVWVTIPGVNLPVFGDQVPVAFTEDSRNIVFLDEMGTQQSYLPGHIALPPARFDLVPQITAVEIDLAFIFDMQLEGGDSNLVFGQDRDWPSNVVQTLQWKLLPGA